MSTLPTKRMTRASIKRSQQEAQQEAQQKPEAKTSNKKVKTIGKKNSITPASNTKGKTANPESPPTMPTTTTTTASPSTATLLTPVPAVATTSASMLTTAPMAATVVTPGSLSSPTTTTLTTTPTPRTDVFRVEEIRSRMNKNGRPSGKGFRKTIIGEYATEEEAVEAAKEARDNCLEFCGWVEQRYGDKSPPYDSAWGKLYGYPIDTSDDHVEIKMVDLTPSPQNRKFGLVCGEMKYDDLLGHDMIDEEIFCRNPCRVPGGESNPPEAYGAGREKGSYPFLVQRLSNRNYTMRSVCLDQGSAIFYHFSLARYFNNRVGWMPDTNLNDHAKDESIVDCCHLDMIHTGTTFKLRLTSDALKATVKADTKCLFLLGFDDHDALVDAIDTCADSLRCISLTCTALSKKLLEALCKCTKLEGITIATEDSRSQKCADDKGMAAVLKACSQTLKWIYIDSWIFETESWRVLDDYQFPQLEVLWVNNTTSSDNGVECRRGIAVGDHSVIRSALKERGPSLKLCMVNPGKSIHSRYTVGKKSDLLRGNKFSPPKW